MSYWKLYLNGNEMDSLPVGINEFKKRIERETDIKGLFVKFPFELTFIGDAYRYLKDTFDNSGYCDLVDVRLDFSKNGRSYTTEVEGKLPLSDLVFNLQHKQAQAQITDNNFFGLIYNRRKNKAVLGAGTSINGVDISHHASNIPIQIRFTIGGPPGNPPPFENRWAVDIYDAFKYLVAYMTDDQVQFTSGEFAPGGLYPGVCILTGPALTDNANELPEIDFETLFQEIDKRFNIGIAVDLDAATPTVRIDPMDSFYNTAESVDLGEVLDVELKVKTDLLYSKLKIGSTKTDFDVSVPNKLLEFDFLTFKEEEYAITGTCNIENELDLVGDWIVDNNIIQDMTVNGASYPDDIILTNYDPATMNVKTTGYANLTQAYNFVFLNSQIADRYLGGVPAPIARYLGGGNDEFEARNDDGTLITTIPVDPVKFDDVINDPNGVFSGAPDYYFEASLNGVYTFFSNMVINWKADDPNNDYQFTLFLDIYTDNTLSTLHSSNQIFTETVRGSAVIVKHNSYDYYLPVGYVARLRLEQDYTGIGGSGFYLEGSEFGVAGSVSGGGIYKEYNPEEYKVLLYDFEAPLTRQQMQKIFNNPTQKIRIRTCDGDVVAWPDMIEYNYLSGMTEFSLLKSQEIETD